MNKIHSVGVHGIYSSYRKFEKHYCNVYVIAEIPAWYGLDYFFHYSPDLGPCVRFGIYL